MEIARDPTSREYAENYPALGMLETPARLRINNFAIVLHNQLALTARKGKHTVISSIRQIQSNKGNMK